MYDPTRLKICNLAREQVAPLDAILPKLAPDVWREIALSVFVTLLSNKNWREMPEEQLALKSMEGVAIDLGGQQPYIPTGDNLVRADWRRKKVLEMLAEGVAYADAGRAVGITESRVRKIQAVERRKQKSTAQEAGKPR